ncbi:pyrimidine 5'-nucleotidase [Dechloromonas sp. ZY10]|uniref:pyrimidine 5'-nucleotidase n=1 Tax=Dechloromonas aquae TaxID=2664436 RepID=UPI003526EB1F
MSPPPTWLFDLDNTLHNASARIFPHINRAMREYIERHLGLDRYAADRLRADYWRRYGATLLGLVRHHATDPQHFLDETHRFPDLERMIVFEKPLLHALKRLPGRKILFTNGPAAYANAVLALTGLQRHFDSVYSVERLRFQPKPSRAAFDIVLRNERLTPHRCILVEDSLENLVTAKKLGMRTVWINTGMRQSPFVDLKLRSVRELPHRYGRL